jgi:hypothetical protein
LKTFDLDANFRNSGVFSQLFLFVVSALAIFSVSFHPILQSVETAIGQQQYQHNKVSQWSSNIVEQCLKRLTSLGKPFKYVGMWLRCRCAPGMT